MDADWLSRCDWCGWPLADAVSKGCVMDNCSMRPLPEITEQKREKFDVKRAARTFLRERDAARAEAAKLRERVGKLEGALRPLVQRGHRVGTIMGHLKGYRPQDNRECEGCIAEALLSPPAEKPAEEPKENR